MIIPTKFRVKNADFGTSGNSIPSSPCKSSAPICNGSVQIAATNTNNLLNSHYVYVNGQQNSTTANGGLTSVTFANILYGNDQNISVYCSTNSSKLCEAKQTSIDFNGDVDNLVFNCNAFSEEKILNLEMEET